jgi:hypothetical protein
LPVSWKQFFDVVYSAVSANAEALPTASLAATHANRIVSGTTPTCPRMLDIAWGLRRFAYLQRIGSREASVASPGLPLTLLLASMEVIEFAFTESSTMRLTILFEKRTKSLDFGALLALLSKRAEESNGGFCKQAF